MWKDRATNENIRIKRAFVFGDESSESDLNYLSSIFLNRTNFKWIPIWLQPEMTGSISQAHKVFPSTMWCWILYIHYRPRHLNVHFWYKYILALPTYSKKFLVSKLFHFFFHKKRSWSSCITCNIYTISKNIQKNLPLFLF